MATWRWNCLLKFLTDEYENEFSQIKNEDFVSFCFENKFRTFVEDYLRSVKRTGKDGAVAAQKKDEGNKSFLDNKYEESLQLYTASIFYAEKNDKNLPVFYANRALALQKMNHLRESLSDIDLAIAYGYSKEKMKKLTLRRAKCLADLAEEEGKKKKLKKEYKLPKLAGGENKYFASASAYLSIFYDEIRGRHVIANKNINVGEVLFVEKPFAFVASGQGCMHCLKAVLAPIPCESCLDMSYCSIKCRDDSWKSGHSFQCGFDELFKSVGIAHLSLEVIIAASSSFRELKNKLNSFSEPEYEKGPVLLKSKGYESVYNLVHHTDKFEANDLFQSTMTALLVATYLKNYTNYFPVPADDEQLKLLTSVILRHILQMICNGSAIKENMILDRGNSVILDKVRQRMATAIYPSVSMMNHSCEPSIILRFHGSCVIVLAAKEIKEGEEVFNCYGADAKRMKRALRQEILRTQYFFDCKCEACLEKYDIHDKFTAFKCLTCKGPLVRQEDGPRKGVCIDCGVQSEIPRELILKENKFYALLREGDMLMATDVESSLKKSLEAWKLGREIFYKFHKDLCYAADTVAKCLAVKNDFKTAASFLKSCLLSVEERFGFLSSELIEELNKMLDVQLAYVKSLPTPELSERVLADLMMVQKKILKILHIFDGNPSV